MNVYWTDNQTSSNHVLFVVTQTVFKWLFWASFFHLCNASFSLETNALVSECTPEIIHMAQIPCMYITYIKNLLALLLLKTTALFCSPGLPFFSVQKSHSEYFGNDLLDLCSSLDVWWTYPFYTACFHSCHPRHTFHKDTPVFASPWPKQHFWTFFAVGFCPGFCSQLLQLPLLQNGYSYGMVLNTANEWGPRNQEFVY